MPSHVFKTKTLALHSIQKNMIACEVSTCVIRILLATNYIVKIITPSEKDAKWIFNVLNFYPSESGNRVSGDNNSVDTDFEMIIQIYANFNQV